MVAEVDIQVEEEDTLEAKILAPPLGEEEEDLGLVEVEDHLVDLEEGEEADIRP